MNQRNVNKFFSNISIDLNESIAGMSLLTSADQNYWFDNIDFFSIFLSVAALLSGVSLPNEIERCGCDNKK